MTNEATLEAGYNHVGEFVEIDYEPGLPRDEMGRVDLHRPFIDELQLDCPDCHVAMIRATDVIDCWFDSGTGAQIVSIRNTASGATNLAGFSIGNDSSAYTGQLHVHSTTYTTSGAAIADAITLECGGAGGIQISSNNVAGDVAIWTGGSNKVAKWTAAGHYILTELTANPTTDDLPADAAVAVYTKADKLVFAYNNGGTLTFVTLDLDGSDTSLTHGTSAP